jgi:hypothetical protein
MEPVLAGVEMPPLFQPLSSVKKSDGYLEIVRCLDPAQDMYLHDHRLDGKLVLPAAMAIELMAEAAQIGWSQFSVSSLQDFRVFKGIVLDNSTRHVRILIRQQENITPQQEAIRHVVTITDDERPERMFYKATVILRRYLSKPRQYEALSDSNMKKNSLSPAEAYDEFLFHGPLFRCIQHIEGISKQGIIATVAPSSPKACLSGIQRGNWLMDPVVLDSGPQLAIIWGRTYLDITPLPSRFRAVHLFKPFHHSPSIHCQLHVLERPNKHTILANVYFVEPKGSVIGMIEGLESTGSKSLNRLVAAKNSL